MQISNFNNLELSVKKLKKTTLPLPRVVKKAFMGYYKKPYPCLGLSRKHSWDTELKCYPCLG